MLRKIGYAGNIISFEPSPADFAALAAQFANDENWTGMPTALGDVEGEVAFNIIPSMSVLNSILEPITLREIKTQPVKVRRLDRVLPEIIGNIDQKRIFLKIDTQGYDVKYLPRKPWVHGPHRRDAVRAFGPIYKGEPHYLEALACFEAGFELISLSVVTRGNMRIQTLNCLMQRRLL